MLTVIILVLVVVIIIWRQGIRAHVVQTARAVKPENTAPYAGRRLTVTRGPRGRLVEVPAGWLS